MIAGRGARGGEDRGLVGEVREVGAGEPGGLARDEREVDVGPSGLARVCTSRIASRPETSGGETKTWRSKRPGRSSAGSSFSSRFEAAMTTRSPVVLKPSISTSSWLSVCSRSELWSEPRWPPTASISSMKMIAGRCLRASANRRRMRAAPRPANISTNGGRRLREELGAGLVRHGLGQQRLAGAGRPVQQDALRHAARRARGSARARAGSRRPRAAPPWPRRRRRRRPRRPRSPTPPRSAAASSAASASPCATGRTRSAP